jgi:riboflavin synthase
MFTGIVECTGVVLASSPGQLAILSEPLQMSVGDSIAVNGVCLTVTGVEGERFTADLSEETLRRTSLGAAEEGHRVNLERPIPVDGRLGGHLVQGHVDGLGYVVKSTKLPGSIEMWFSLPQKLERYLVEKGSVTIDGVSLTIVGLETGKFSVSLVPHTLESTNLGDKAVGDPVNIEVDVVAKYLERLMDGAAPRTRKGGGS